MTEDEKRVYPGAPDQEPAPVFDQQQSLFEDENGTGIIGECFIDEDSIEIYGENPPAHEDFADMLTSEDPEEIKKILEDIKRSVGRQVTLSEEFAKHATGVGGEALADILDAKEILRGMFDGMAAMIPALSETTKYIMQALKSPLYDGITLNQLLEDYRKPREDGEPSLFGQLLATAWALIEADKKKLTPAERRKEAKESGNVLLNMGTKQVLITNRDYQFALTPIPNDWAYIKVYDSGSINWADIASKPDGAMDWQPPSEEEEKKLPPAPDIDLPLLNQIFTAIYKSGSIMDADRHTVTVYYPEFCRSMGITPRSDNNSSSNDLFKKIEAFKGCVGITNGNQYRKLLDVLAFDQEKQTITFATPYMNHLILSIKKNVEDNPIKRLKNGKTILKPAYSHLVHSTIAKERNKAAVSMVYAIVSLIEQRGTTPDAELKQNKGKKFKDPEMVKCDISYETLLSYTPDILDRIDKAQTTADKNKTLQRATEKAFDLLPKKTDIFKYYKDLAITTTRKPTVNTLNAVITITHHGKNGEYVNND